MAPHHCIASDGRGRVNTSVSVQSVYSIQAMALRLLTDAVLLFSSSVGLLLKRDAELWAKLHPADTQAK